MHLPYHWLCWIWLISAFLPTDKVVSNHPDLFSLKPRAPVSSSDHCLLLLGPKIYPRSAPHSFRRTNQIQFRLRNFSHNNFIPFLAIPKSLSLVSICFSFELLLNNNFTLFTETTNAISDICSSSGTLFVSTGRISTQKLKSQRRCKERFYVFYNNSSGRYTSDLIKAETQRIDTTFASQILSGNNNRFPWQGIRLLFGKEDYAEFSADVGSTKRAPSMLQL